MRGVILEGIDCGGKTTFAEKLKHELKKYGGYDVVGLVHKESDDQYERYLFEYAARNKVIFDRAHFSEVVYSVYFGRKVPFIGKQLDILNKVVGTDYVVILAEPSAEVFSKRIEETIEEQTIGVEAYSNIVSAFRNSMEEIQYICYNSRNYEEMNALIHKVIDKLHGSV